MSDENFGFDRHTFANKRVTRYFAALADFRSFLNLNKGANPGFVSYLATVKVNEAMDTDIAPQFNIRSY